MKKGDLLLHKRYNGLWMFIEEESLEWIRVLSLCKKNLPYIDNEMRIYTELKVDFIEI